MMKFKHLSLIVQGHAEIEVIEDNTIGGLIVVYGLPHEEECREMFIPNWKDIADDLDISTFEHVHGGFDREGCSIEDGYDVEVSDEDLERVFIEYARRQLPQESIVWQKITERNKPEYGVPYLLFMFLTEDVEGNAIEPIPFVYKSSGYGTYESKQPYTHFAPVNYPIVEPVLELV